MTEIGVRRVAEDDDGFDLEVGLTDPRSTTSHAVTLTRADLARLGRPGEAPEAFVERCFAFLLEREPKESILPQFDVSVIERYFPEFERTIEGGARD